jgi:phosphoglycolate phosphatase
LIPKFKAYLFDVDGTLLDSAADICGAVESVLSKHLPQVPEFAYLKSFVGRHLQDLWEEVLPGQTEEFYAALLADYRQTYLGKCHPKTRVFPGVKQGLSRLGGLKTTATTKSSATAAAVLTQFELIEHFQHVQGTDGFPAKPEPEVILRALSAIGVEPSEALMVGDALPDLLAARAAGIPVCLVKYGYGDIGQLEQYKPEFWIQSLEELAD